MPLDVEVSPEAAARGAIDKIAAARVWLLKEKPFFGVLARALRVEPSAALGTAFRLHANDRVHTRIETGVSPEDLDANWIFF